MNRFTEVPTVFPNRHRCGIHSGLLCTSLLVALGMQPLGAQQYEVEREAERKAAEILEPRAGARTITRDVTVSEGDTLGLIAQRELGSAGYAAELADFNGIDLADTLAIGQVLRIPIRVPAEIEGARVIFVKGEVTIGSNTAVEEDMLIGIGDTLVTGPEGYISLEFSSGSVINLQPDSRARITDLNCLSDDINCVIEIQSDTGEIRSDVNGRSDQPVEFRIETPFASAAVRGTVFDFGTESDTLRVGVTEGGVDINASNASVSLDQGFGSVTEAGSPPGEPESLLPPPVYKSIPPRMTREDVIQWWPLQTASAYELSLAADPAGQLIHRSWSTEADSLRIDDMNAGNYHILLRAFSERGLKGFTSNAELTIAAIDDSLDPVPTRVSRDGNEYLVQIDTGVAAAFRNTLDDEEAPELTAEELDAAPVGYEIQLSTTADFADPLSVDVDRKGQAVFQIDADEIHARARILVNPLSVSAFGRASVGR